MKGNTRLQRKISRNASADGDAHAGAGPQTGGGGQTLDLLLAGDQHGTRAQKADAVDHLGAEPGDILVGFGQLGRFCPVGSKHLGLVLTQKHGQGSSHADQHIGSDAGRAALAHPLKTQQSAQDQSKTLLSVL